MVNILTEKTFLRLIFLIYNLSVTTVLAGSFSISPVRLTLSQQSGSQIITLRNDSTESTVIQIEVVKWSQNANQDHYSPSRQLLATPPIFTVAAGASQVIRVGLRHPPSESIEQAYRLFIQEVPPPPVPGKQGLQMALRISMPVFITPAHAVAPDLHWQAKSENNNSITISASNTGNAHIHLSALKIYQDNNPPPLYESKLFNYLLPGTSYTWSFTPTHKVESGATLRIEVINDAGQSRHDIVLDKL